jgi:hypothetical protein
MESGTVDRLGVNARDAVVNFSGHGSYKFQVSSSHLQAEEGRQDLSCMSCHCVAGSHCRRSAPRRRRGHIRFFEEDGMDGKVVPQVWHHMEWVIKGLEI